MTAKLTESGYTGVYSLSSQSCTTGSGNTSGNVASVTPTGGNVPQTLTITAQGAGACTYTFKDATGQTATLTVNVTTTTVIVNGRKKRESAPAAPAPQAGPSLPDTPRVRPR
jgi:hypothetical protein